LDNWTTDTRGLYLYANASRLNTVLLGNGTQVTNYYLANSPLVMEGSVRQTTMMLDPDPFHCRLSHRRFHEVFPAAVGTHQILEQPEQHVVGLRIHDTELVVSIRKRPQRGISRVLQDESIMGRGVQVWNDLDVIAQGIVGQLLQLGGSEGVRLDNRRRAPELEMPLLSAGGQNQPPVGESKPATLR
jgi:hypothetical protein